MGDQHVSVPQQSQPAPVVAGGAPTAATPNDSAAATAGVERRKKAAAALSKPWITALGGLYPPDAPTNPSPSWKVGTGDVEKLKAGAYDLATKDAKGASDTQEYLTAAEADESYRSAVRMAADSVSADAKKLEEISKAIVALTVTHEDLSSAGMTVLAKIALLSDEGKGYLSRHHEIAKPLRDYIGQKLSGTDEATVASRNAYEGLANAIENPAIPGKTPGDGKGPAPLAGPELEKAKALIEKIKQVFSTMTAHPTDGKTPSTNKATPQQMTELRGLISGATPEIRDWIYAWREDKGPNTGKGVLELMGSYMSPQQVEEMSSILDPVEQLYKDLFDNRNGKRDPKLPKVSAFQLIHDFLAKYPGEGGAPTRKRVQNDARIMEPFTYTCSDAEKKILIRMIVTGREEPDAIDKLQAACDAKDASAACAALFEIGGRMPGKLDELRSDLIFVHRLRDTFSAGMTESHDKQAQVSGVSMNPYELFLRMCGIDPFDTKEAGSVDKQKEANPDANDKALDENELGILEDKLYKPFAKPLADELNSWWTKDSKVMGLLTEFQKACAGTDVLPLIHRSKQAPGPTLSSRIQAAGCDVRLKIARGLSDDNLHTAERVLGFVADQATTGVIGGQGTLAGDTDAKGGKTVGLEQALRETTLADGGIVTQVVHQAAADMAAELGRWLGARPSQIGGIWKTYSQRISEDVCADLRTKTGLPRVWAVELLGNAFLPIGGGTLESKLHTELGKEGNDVITAMGMSPTDIAARRTMAEQKVSESNLGGQAGADANQAKLDDAGAQVKAAEQAEQFRTPAKELFDALAGIHRGAEDGVLREIGNKLRADMKLSSSAPAPAGVTVGPKPAPVAEGGIAAKPTDFPSFYKKEYGIDPRRHAVEVAKALADKERTAQQIGEMLDVIDPSLYAPPEAPKGEEVVIDKANVTLVGPAFTVEEANKRGQKIWDIIHGGDQGAVQLIRQQFGSTQEEDRLINIAFRKLSAGIDIQFYLQQHLAQQAAWEKTQGKSLDMAGLQVGGGGVGDADKRGVHVVGLAAETDAAAERAANGKISIEKQLATLVAANNMNEVYTIIESATEEQRRAVLSNSELMTKLRGFGDDSYEWNRIYKGLTGQADLYDKLESRAHGKHGILGGAFEGTDEKGMADDIKEQAKKRKAEIRVDVLKEFFNGAEPKNDENRKKVDKEVDRRLKIEFAAHMSNPSIRALLTDEMSGAELAKTEGQLLNSGEEDKTASVLTEGDFTEDEEKILDDIKRMSPSERAAARNNPEYIAQLRKAIQSQATWRDAMILLESTEDGSKGENDDNYAKLERASRSIRQDSTELMFEENDVIEALSKLTPDEFARLMANPRLQAQILTSLEGKPDLLAKARQMLAYNAANAADATGLHMATPDQPADPAKGIYDKAVVERLAFLKFSAKNQIQVGAGRGWGVLLQAAVAVYNMKLNPTEAGAAAKAGADAQKGGGDDGPLQKGQLADETAGTAKPAANGTPAPQSKPAEKKEAAPPPDPKTSDSGIEARLRQEILDDCKDALGAIDAWGTQKSEGASHERIEIDAAKQHQLITDGILHTSDPSNALLLASTGVFGDDEDRIKETLRKASDEQLIRQWSNCVAQSPDGSKSLKKKYEEWKATRLDAGRPLEADPKPEPGAAPAGGKPSIPKMNVKKYDVGGPEWTKRTAFKTHVVDTSDVFEDLLLKYTGGLFADDAKMEPGKKVVRDNSEWLEWRSIVRDRFPTLDREKIGREIGAGEDHEAMDVLRDPNAKVLTDTLSGLEYDEERYLVDRGVNSNYNMDRATADGEGLALDNAMDAYKQQVMGSVITDPNGKDAADDYGHIDAAEQAKIAEAKGRFQKNDAAFREAKSAVAQVAATVVALIITAVVTILTAGTATGPVATILIAAITAGTASAGSQLTKEAIQGTDFDMGKEGLQAIARDTIMGAITAGTTWYAGKIANGLFSAGSAAEQAAIIARTAANPGFFAQMGRAMVENSLQTGMQGLFESGMAAFDPAMWLDGWNEGWRRGTAAARSRAEEIPLEMLRAAVIAAMTHTANAGINKLKGGAAEPQPAGWSGKHEKLPGGNMPLGDRTEEVLGKMGHGAKEGVLMGGAEILLDEKTYRAEGLKPEAMMGHMANSAASMAQLSATGMHAEDAAGYARAEAVERNLAANGDQLSPNDQALYRQLATTQGGHDTSVLSVEEFKRAKDGMIERAVAKYEADTERKLEPAEKAAFEKHVNEAKTLDEYIKRAEAGPHGAPGVTPTPVIPKFDKPAERESGRNKAKELLDKLKESAASAGEKVKEASAQEGEHLKAIEKAKGLLDDINSKAVTDQEKRDVATLAGRLAQVLGEIQRAFQTVAGGSSLEAVRGQLQAALDAAIAAPDDANVHKALHKVLVEATVANATSPKDAAQAAADLPKKLAALEALTAELEHAKDNADRRALDRKANKSEDTKETKKESTTAEDEANKEKQKEAGKGGDNGANKELAKAEQDKLDWFVAQYGSANGPVEFEKWKKSQAERKDAPLSKSLPEEQRKAIADKVPEKPGDYIGETVDKSQLSDELSDIERWQTHGLEETATDPDTGKGPETDDPKVKEKRAQATATQKALLEKLADPEFRHWYDVWMSMPDRILIDADGNATVNLPPGIPAEHGEYLKKIAKAGNVALFTRALSVSQRIQQEFPGLDSDPESAAWKKARPKLVEMLGEKQVEKYEGEVAGKKDPKRVAAERERIDQLISKADLAAILELCPGAKVFVTGSGAQMKKGVSEVADFDLVVVMPKGSTPQERAALEHKLQSMKVERGDGAGVMSVDAKVMTDEQFMGFSMAKTPPDPVTKKERTPLDNIRIDEGAKGPLTGGEESSGGGPKPASFEPIAKSEAQERLTKERPFTPEEQRQFDDLSKKYGQPKAEDVMKEWLALQKTPMPPVDNQMGQDKTEDKHAQIEVHNHITGVATPEQFLAQMEGAGKGAKPGQPKWMPLLEAIANLKHGEHAFGPDGKIAKRGVSGDANVEVQKALAEIRPRLDKLKDLTGDQLEAEVKAIDKIAKDAIDKALKSSDDTDFNSAYELRDELIKQYYGKAERDQMMAELGDAGKGDEFTPAKANKFTEHFQGRPRVLEAIQEALAAQQELSTNKALDPKRIKELKKKIGAVGEQLAYDQFMMDTIEQLAKDGLRYSEQSVSANKMDQRFDPEQFGWVKAKLEAKLLAEGNKDLAQRVRDLDVKYVAMMNTTSFGGHDENVKRDDINTSTGKDEKGKPVFDKDGTPRFSNNEVDQQAFDAQVDQIARQALRPDSVGVDIAGMEHMVFDETGKARFRQLYDRLLLEAKKHGQVLVLRPHVGEGATDVVNGEAFNTSSNRQTKDGELTADLRAENNVKALLEVCQQIADEHGGKLPPEVVIRFGHATHATPEMAAKMAELGIIAEINLVSNQATGASSPTDHPLGGGDKKKGDPSISKKEHPLDEHSLASFIYNGAQIILSTDGHSVMSTGLGQEYAQAKGVIEDIRNNKYPVFITAEQARAERMNGGTVAEPQPGEKVVPIYYGEMSSESKKKFDAAERKLYDDAHKYFDNRPKTKDGTPPPDDSAPKKAAAQEDALSAADREANAREDGKTGDDLKKASASEDQREVLQNELKRQVPDVELMTAVQAGEANTVVSLVFPGSSGDFGIKRMNDEAIGLQLNSALMQNRDAIVKEIFASHGLKIVDQNYKCTTVVSKDSPEELAPKLKAAMAEIDKKMAAAVRDALEAGHKHWSAEAEKIKAAGGDFANDKTYQNAMARVKKIEELQKKVAEADSGFKFDMHLGVAKVEGNTYGDALAAEMNASKAAIMSRDPLLKRQGTEVGDDRANVFDENHFVQFCKDTVAMRQDLIKETITFHGVPTPVMTEQGMNRDILRDLRKGKIDRTSLTPAEQAVFDKLELYFTRINALDYFKSFTGPETEAQGKKVEEAMALMKQLQDGEPMSKEMAEKLRELLAGDRPQSGTASEAAFFNRAEGLEKRVILNADIKDMGLDLFEGYEGKMDDIAKGDGNNLRDVSETAADKIVEAKRRSEAQFRKFYENYLLKKAIAEAKARGRTDLVQALEAEKEPMILLGGDEITVSLHTAFEELGLLNLAVRKLSNPEGTNGRVAVTHTDPDLGGRFGHLKAMGAGQTGQDLLKDYEKKARELRQAAGKQSGAERTATLALADKIERMSTIDEGGRTVLVDAEGNRLNTQALDEQINKTLKKPKDEAKKQKSRDDDSVTSKADRDDKLN